MVKNNRQQRKERREKVEERIESRKEKNVEERRMGEQRKEERQKEDFILKEGRRTDTERDKRTNSDTVPAVPLQHCALSSKHS